MVLLVVGSHVAVMKGGVVDSQKMAVKEGVVDSQEVEVKEGAVDSQEVVEMVEEVEEEDIQEVEKEEGEEVVVAEVVAEVVVVVAEEEVETGSGEESGNRFPSNPSNSPAVLVTAREVTGPAARTTELLVPSALVEEGTDPFLPPTHDWFSRSKRLQEFNIARSKFL